MIATAYGQLLLAKLVLAGAALGLGALNKVSLTARLRDAPVQARGQLRASLAAEAVLFAGALVLVALATTIAGPGAG